MAQRLVYHWKHGWIPLDRAAALSKAHGSKTGASKLLGHGAPQHGAPAAGDGKSHHLEQSLQAKHETPNPVGKDFRTMTPAQKIKAVEIMYGTGSKQHLTAKKRFGSK